MIIRRQSPLQSKKQGNVLIAAIIVLGTLTVVAAASLSRSMSASRLNTTSRTSTENANLTQSILNIALLKAKDYAWTPGNTMETLLSGGSRFTNWAAGAGTYDGVAYTVAIADNYEAAEGGTQNYVDDKDNTYYMRVTMPINGQTKIMQVLMSPGSSAAGASEPPGELPAAVGICYGWLNFITLLSLGATDTVSGFDTTPAGKYGCPTGGPACAGTVDQHGISTSSWFGAYSLPTIFGWGGNHGTISGLPPTAPWAGTTMSITKTDYTDCAAYDDIQTLADNKLASGSADLTLYQKNFGTLTVAGNKVFGSEAAPKIVYIKTGIFGKVLFTGTVTGYGIIVADGNVEFQQTTNWYGVIINDANAIGNIMTFDQEANLYGATMINRPILSAEIGTGSMDLLFSGINNDIRYSSTIVDSVLDHLDPNYTPPASADGQMVQVASVQMIQ